MHFVAGTVGSVQQSLVGPAHENVRVARGLLPTADLDLFGPSKRAQKERGPNWNGQEIYELIATKKKIALLEMEKRDDRELMMLEAMKWLRISSTIMMSGASSYPCDAAACKNKWN